VNIENIKYLKKLTSIENETNVLKMSFREFPTSGQIFALMDMSFKDGLPDIKELFTPKYIQHKDFEINGITHKYNYQSVLSMILEKMFILFHTDDKMIAIDEKKKKFIIQKFKYSLCHIINLYMNVKNKEWEWVNDFNQENEVNKNVLIQLANMYYKYFYPTDAKAQKIHFDCVFEKEQYPEDLSEDRIELNAAPATRLQMKDWLEAIDKDSLPVADVEEGHISTAACILANISMELGGRPLKYDSKTRTVLNDAEATAKLRRPYRGPWKHPEPSTV
jgi:hypothetical protein